MEVLRSEETPCIIIDYNKLKKNIEWMQAKAKEKGVNLRPHIKTHKSLNIAKLQTEQGAVGITCAKYSEALLFLKNGFKSVTVAYPLIDPLKVEKLLNASSDAQLRLLVDSEEGVKMMMNVAKKNDRIIDLFIKIDVGLGRIGLKEKDPKILTVVKEIVNCPHLRFVGLLSHAGQAYAANNKESIEKITEDERSILLRVKNEIESNLQVKVNEISVGSTPTETVRSNYEGITEMRPGNYVFMDRTQLSKGVISYDHISFFVLATVVSVNQNYIIIDAGSKMLSSDLAPHSAEGVVGYGEAYFIDDYETKKSKMIIAKLSEEHGWIKREDVTGEVTLGSRVAVIPNHSCPTANLSDQYIIINHPDEKRVVWKVDARGCVQ